uniref:Uncharacterized protein n=1 Tax=Anguilla anguilla TaxID=7936 RepID=A0A0E9QII7_ANGAN
MEWNIIIYPGKTAQESASALISNILLLNVTACTLKLVSCPFTIIPFILMSSFFCVASGNKIKYLKNFPF